MDSTGSRDRVRPWVEHLSRAARSFGEHYGSYYAAAITYFSLLSLVPVAMVAFAVAGFVLAGDHALLDRLTAAIGAQAPDALAAPIDKLVRDAVDARATVGTIGLVIALYSGVGWMRHLRSALTEQWRLERQATPLLPTLVGDLLALLGLGAALAVSFAVTAAGTIAGDVLPAVAGVLLALVVNAALFLWVIARLPRRRVSARAAWPGALLAAAGFEVLKQLAGVLLARTGHSPSGAVFGPVLGLLVFVNLTARLLLFATAWTATSAGPSPRS